MTESQFKKGEDPGKIVINPEGIPICTVHGNSLWIEEKNVTDNSALCLGSDKTIYASDNVILTKAHITTKNTPQELDKLAAGLHDKK